MIQLSLILINMQRSNKRECLGFKFLKIRILGVASERGSGVCVWNVLESLFAVGERSESVISSMSSVKKEDVQKVCLVVIDGWGITEETKGNAIHHAKTPVMDGLMSNHIKLHASESFVGNLDGVMGSSKVGHINIGAGRVVWQDMALLQTKIKDGSFDSDPGLAKTLAHAKKSGRIHMLGMVSDGGVHSHIDHLLEYMRVAKANNIPECYVHFFADGRDTQPKTACQYIKKLTDDISKNQYGKIATLMGRSIAMDRDNNWDLTNKAYRVMVHGDGEECPMDKLMDKVTEMQKSIRLDEELEPLVICKDGMIKDGDSLIFFNFRADRMIQIVSLFGVKKPYDGNKHLTNLSVFCTTSFDSDFPFDYMLPIIPRSNSLSEWISSHQLKHYHCAETEKYFHVTKFFNQPHEKPHEGEVWYVVPSPEKPFHDKPRLSVDGVGEKVIEAITSDTYHFVVCNLAPPDLIGHTGLFEPTVLACEATDQVIGKIKEACEKKGFILMVTSDHGNAEQMLEDGQPCPKHTFNKVPLCITGSSEFIGQTPGYEYSLRDVAPTVLRVMKLPIPSEMDGMALVKKVD